MCDEHHSLDLDYLLDRRAWSCYSCATFSSNWNKGCAEKAELSLGGEMAEDNLKKYGKVMEQYNDFVDQLEHGSAKYEQQLPALNKKFIAQLQEQGKLPHEVQSYAQLSQEQRPLVDDLIDEHFAAIDPTIPLVFDSFKCLDLNVDLEKQLLKFWQPIFSNSTAFKRTGKLSPAEISQVEQFRKKIRRQSVEHLNRIHANMLQIVRGCKDAELVAAARSYLILHDRMVSMYTKSNLILVSDSNLL